MPQVGSSSSKASIPSKRDVALFSARVEKEQTLSGTDPMSNGPYRTSFRHIHTLFNVGAAGGISDGELLEMFKDRPGEAGDSAFAAIVERHGPMVHRVCRQVLGNPHDADDAFQATFLILIRKASLLYLSDSLGP